MGTRYARKMVLCSILFQTVTGDVCFCSSSIVIPNKPGDDDDDDDENAP